MLPPRRDERLFLHSIAASRAVTIVRPETVVRWHCMGYAAFWQWKFRRRRILPFNKKRSLRFAGTIVTSSFLYRFVSDDTRVPSIMACILRPAGACDAT